MRVSRGDEGGDAPLYLTGGDECQGNCDAIYHHNLSDMFPLQLKLTKHIRDGDVCGEHTFCQQVSSILGLKET